MNKKEWIKKVWYETEGKKVAVDVIKEYKYRKQEWYKLNVDGKEVKALQEDCEELKRVTIKQPVTEHIEVAETFDKKCLAELYGMKQNGACEFIRGYVVLEVRKRRGVDTYTVWRETADHENYDVEIDTTTDIDLIVRYFTMIENYDFADWFRTFEELEGIRNTENEWYEDILADPFVA